MLKVVSKALRTALIGTVVTALLLCGVPLASAAEVTVVSVEADDVIVIEGADLGDEYHYDDDDDEPIEYKAYYYNPTFRVTFSDGTVVDEEELDEFEHEVYVEDDQYENPWGVGKHTATLWVDDMSADFTVEVVKTPAVSLHVEDVVLGEDSVQTFYDIHGGSWTYYDDTPLSFTVTLDDGTELESLPFAPAVLYNDSYYILEVEDDQSFDNCWEPGNTYTATARILGVETTYKVTILETHIVDVKMDDYTTYAYSGGDYYPEFGDDEELIGFNYYYSDYSVQPHFTVTFSTGETLESDEQGILIYQGAMMLPFFDDDQDIYETWDVGDHQASFTLGSYKGTMDIHILPCPVASIDFEPISLMEDADCVTEYRYEPDPDTEEIVETAYQVYPYTPAYTVTFTDGTSERFTGEKFTHDGATFGMMLYDDQDDETTWGVGEHTAYAFFGAEKYPIPVTVEENPVLSVTAEDVLVSADDYDFGEYKTEYGVTYFKQYVYLPQITVTMKNGDVVQGALESVSYGGREFPVTVSDEQAPDKTWEAGGVYPATVSVMGRSAQLHVKVVDASVSYLPGDVNLDGVTDVTDATYIQMYAAELKDFSELQLTLGDLNRDNVVDISDATLVQQLAADAE